MTLVVRLDVVVSIKRTGSLNYFEVPPPPVHNFSCNIFFAPPLLLSHVINEKKNPPVRLLPPVCLIDTTE